MADDDREEVAVPVFVPDDGRSCEEINIINEVWATHNGTARALRLLMSMMSPCNRCGEFTCYEHAYHWVKFMSDNVMGQGGIINMLMALLDHEGGSITFSAEELERIRHDPRCGSVATARNTNGDVKVYFTDMAQDDEEGQEGEVQEWLM